MSPAQAAHSLKVSRRTIMRAIECLEIKAFRDNKNHWQIAEEDLAAWALSKTAPTDHAHHIPDKMPTPYVDEEVIETLSSIRSQLAAAEAKSELLQALLDREKEAVRDLRIDRDAWRKQAEELTSQSAKKRWWAWKG